MFAAIKGPLFARVPQMAKEEKHKRNRGSIALTVSQRGPQQRPNGEEREHPASWRLFHERTEGNKSYCNGSHHQPRHSRQLVAAERENVGVCP